LSKMNENELVRNLKNGDLAALKRLIEKYQDYVYTIVFQIVKNNELAEEITQDVFIKVHQKIDTFEERAKFSTWLFTITYRLALNQVNKKNITVTESDYHSNSDESESPIDTIQFDVDQQIDFSRYYEYDSKEVQDILWDAIDRLNLQQGLIISLFYLQQFSVVEISDILEISANTVKTQLFRGRNNLKKMLLKNFTPEDLL
jgi:RNA polymerase sigma factor (sigma-70 family)